MGFSLNNFMAGVGQGMSDAGLEGMRQQAEQQRMATLNAYANQLEDRRNAFSTQQEARKEAFTAEQSNLDRASKTAMNEADNASAEKRTGMITGVQREELQSKQPLFANEADKNKAMADYYRAKSELDQGNLDWKQKWEAAKTPEEKADTERGWTLWNKRKQLEVQKASKGYQFGTVDHKLYRGNRDTGVSDFPAMPTDSNDAEIPDYSSKWKSTGGKSEDMSPFFGK